MTITTKEIKRVTLKARRANKLYTKSLIKHGNGKLKDYDDVINDVLYRYAQFNLRALLDCPFRSAGCEAVCYATKGNHNFPTVKKSRENAYNVSKSDNFHKMMIYTIRTELNYSKRYKNNVMILRIHESGDFYSLQYLRKWLKVWKYFINNNNIVFVFYTKSFSFFNMLTEEEKKTIRKLQKKGRVAISASLDDTTNLRQKTEYLKMIANYPLTNTYYCTEDITAVKHDNECDCKDCAKCGICNSAKGKKTVVKIHSASNNDLEKYRENIA